MPDTALPASRALGDVHGNKLRQYVDQAIAAKARVKDAQEDLAAVFATAVADGFDKKVMAVLIKRLESEPKTLTEHDHLLALYEAAYHAADDEDAAA
jgi:uncharacterized protein (UPF0335 family)